MERSLDESARGPRESHENLNQIRSDMGPTQPRLSDGTGGRRRGLPWARSCDSTSLGSSKLWAGYDVKGLQAGWI